MQRLGVERVAHDGDDAEEPPLLAVAPQEHERGGLGEQRLLVEPLGALAHDVELELERLRDDLAPGEVVELDRVGRESTRFQASREDVLHERPSGEETLPSPVGKLSFKLLVQRSTAASPRSAPLAAAPQPLQRYLSRLPSQQHPELAQGGLLDLPDPLGSSFQP
ncbi:hypothetical protein WME97_14175 [Sorangium sp. So ce367]